MNIPAPNTAPVRCRGLVREVEEAPTVYSYPDNQATTSALTSTADVSMAANTPTNQTAVPTDESPVPIPSDELYAAALAVLQTLAADDVSNDH